MSARLFFVSRRQRQNTADSFKQEDVMHKREEQNRGHVNIHSQSDWFRLVVSA